MLLDKIPQIFGKVLMACSEILSKKDDWLIQRILISSLRSFEQIEPFKQRQEITEIEKILDSHGLSQNDPLTVEAIIRGCFNNPNRKLFPDFLSNRRGS